MVDRVEDLERRLARDPNSKIFAQLAEEYRKQGRLDQAIATCRDGLSKHPTYFSARVALGRALFDAGSLDEAKSEFQRVLAEVPDNILAHRYLAETQFQLGDLEEALATYQGAHRLSPSDGELAERIREIHDRLASPPADGGSDLLRAALGTQDRWVEPSAEEESPSPSEWPSGDSGGTVLRDGDEMIFDFSESTPDAESPVLEEPAGRFEETSYLSASGVRAPAGDAGPGESDPDQEVGEFTSYVFSEGPTSGSTFDIESPPGSHQDLETIVDSSPWDDLGTDYGRPPGEAPGVADPAPTDGGSFDYDLAAFAGIGGGANNAGSVSPNPAKASGSPDDRWSERALAARFEEEGRLDQALGIYLKLQAADPKNPGLQQKVADLRMLLETTASKESPAPTELIRPEVSSAPGPPPASSLPRQEPVVEDRALEEALRRLEGWLEAIRRKSG